MQQQRKRDILIAGIGNRLRGDDGFGPRVIDLLSSRQLPEIVEVQDFGTAGVTIASELGDYQTGIFVDAIKQGQRPGTLYKFEITVGEIEENDITNLVSLTLHEARLAELLAFAKAIGSLPARVVAIGCEPGNLELTLELSPEVENALAEAVDMILDELDRK